MWSKSKKHQGDWQGRQEDYEQDIQSLREERDDLKAWCKELESRQRQQGFSQQVFRFWANAMLELKRVKARGGQSAQLLGEKNQQFLSHHVEYAGHRKDLLEYVDSFTDAYRQINHSHERMIQIQAHASKVIACSSGLDDLAERLRLLSLNIAIESSYADKQQLSDSISGSLREMSDTTRKVSVEIAALNQRIEADSGLAENYFTTVTEGFIGFSRAISPLLTAADRSSELILELAFIAREWAVDNLQQSMQTDHILWKFDVYSLLLGIVDGPIAGRGGLGSWEGMLQPQGAALARIDETLLRVEQLGEDIQRHHSAVDSEAVLSDLQVLDQLGEQLFQCFDELRKEMLSA